MPRQLVGRWSTSEHSGARIVDIPFSTTSFGFVLSQQSFANHIGDTCDYPDCSTFVRANKMKASDLPDFNALPRVHDLPQGCAWGVFDQDGKRDNLGTLNLLTPEVVLAAKDEIKAGISVSVNWPLNKVHQPGFGRKMPEHKIMDLKPGNGGRPVHDDEVHINTQVSNSNSDDVYLTHEMTNLLY